MAQITRPPSNPAAPTLKVNGLNMDYFSPKEYIIGGTTLTGAKYLDKEVIITLSKLIKGEHITLPGEATGNAIKNLWAQGLFDDIKLDVAKLDQDTVYFEIEVVERPRLSSFEITGVSKSQKTDITEKLNAKTGKTIINENLYNTTTGTIKKYLSEKGYFFTKVNYKTRPDANQENGVVLEIMVDKGRKVKVHEINFTGNKVFTSAKLRKFLKKTKQQAFYKIFGSGKFNKEKYEEDKTKLIAKMQERGYRDAAIVKDSIYQYSDKAVGIKIEVFEGPKYYFGDISWSGNAKYATNVLQKVLGIEKGEVFSEERLEKKLRGSASSDDVSSIYLNDGYLTFNIDPVQTKIHGDTVDLEMRIYEGPQYTNNRITIKGNTITNDRVVRREIRTKPGEKFSKELLVRTVREIGQLGNFDESKTVPTPKPNPADGTVDIEYAVEEKPSDQVELSGGFGGGRIIGTLGLTFNNFSLRNLFNLKAYKPLPKGDGQKLSLRGQTNGKQYQSYSFSFSEPWLGGKKPLSFGISAFTSLSSNAGNTVYGGVDESDSRFQKIRLNGVTVSLGRRLNWPDNYFQLTHSVNIQQYILNNYPGYKFSTGTSYNFNLTQEFSRDSRDSPIFPTGGSYFRFTVQATPPYSLLNNINYATASDKQRYKFTEYHKWKLEGQWFNRIAGKLVLMSQAQFGFLGTYNKAVGEAAFERFKLGGDGMQGFDFLQGSEIIKMRGYANNAVIPVGSTPYIAQNSGSPIFTKYVLELRYPVIASQQATAYIVGFAEGGNTWNTFKEYNPFNIRRSAGIGARIFLPIFGMLGIDYGHAFDRIPGIQDGGKQNFTFSIAQQLGGFQ
ncbi:Beta-barrel assembly machine subunit BamA [Pedobacter nutrimenti]|jgi:outer membrane protein insertion porin family|uniref:Outer membrane protein assembly factor BamA n=2 Tax=Pedobacter nutrimenti TaxID=1241337 RepID=A0A318UAS6_9SPHI|nr:outer membrane protein assembly factor BamA [Pedobacter nutrimenti]PYF72540.1 Beta-barrel assembly machine subunit BamA [Pedobacter nutrimenti]|eukprot:gene3034-3482_t